MFTVWGMRGWQMLEKFSIGFVMQTSSKQKRAENQTRLRFIERKTIHWAQTFYFGGAGDCGDSGERAENKIDKIAISVGGPVRCQVWTNSLFKSFRFNIPVCVNNFDSFNSPKWTKWKFSE